MAAAGDLQWTRSDGHHIAYRVIEADPDSEVTVVLLSGIFLPIEMMWGDRGHARFLDGLADLGRLVVFDRRGIGASDPVADWSEPIAHQWARDVVRVVEAIGRPAHLVGWEQGGVQALLAAAARPDLVRSVTVFHGFDRVERLEAMLGLPLPEIAEMVAGWFDDGDQLVIQGDDVSRGELYHPSRADDPSLVRWLQEAGRRGASPATAARVWRSLCTPGTGVDPASVLAPALILRRRDQDLVTAEMGRDMAALLPQGSYAEVPGTDFAPYCEDIDALVAEIGRFITGSDPVVRSADRELATVLFTDVVGSTEAAGALGDANWRGVLDAHDEAIERVVVRRGGRTVKHTGDGVLAVFPLASQAVRAAVELRIAMGAIGLRVRQGLHIGEVIDRDGDISGMAVHVASRVMAAAGSNEILVSATIPLALVGDSVVFEPRGRSTLKGVPGTWELFAVPGA